MVPATDTDLLQLLHDRFGLEQFRPGQREVIEEVLRGRDVLCVMPTGGGKSLCYQLPAIARPGVTLVVSPLIALMKDQVDALSARGIRATLINSTIEPEEQRLRIQQIESGAFDLVYVAPERFRSSRFVEAMTRTKLALLAIDEAHCISEWGHDFRPDYAKIGNARRLLGHPPCIALTATATDLVRRDIADQLNLTDPAQFVTGFDRPNLSYAVIDANRDRDKLSVLAEVLNSTPGSSIVYASSRAKCEQVTLFLTKDLHRTAVVYHAGLSREERERAQNAFMSGDAEVVVATNAFGMGIDKPNIRSVVHFNYPGTVEAYYQEAGRAGRDGLPARCVLLYSTGDRMLQEMFIDNEYPTKTAVFQIYEFLRNREEDPIELTHAQIKDSSGVELNESGVGSVIKILDNSGALERFLPRENQAIVRIDSEPDSLSMVDRISPQAHVQRTVLFAVEAMVGRRYGEPIYFHPDTLAAQLGLERTALVRALRSLSEELPISYIPPFRGNAIRIVDRDKRAKQIDIDFSALETRRRREHGKLERMIQYAQSRDCRRANILNYFGDKAANRCGRCDNCGVDGSLFIRNEAQLIDDPAGLEVILKTMSGVARAKGRVGKNLIAQMLVGSNSEKVQRAGLKSLSTFGLLGSYRQAEVVAILDGLSRARLIAPRQIDQNRPVLELTDEGRAYLKEPTPIALDLPADLARKVSGADSGTPRGDESRTSLSSDPSDDASGQSPQSDDALLQRLKAMRKAWAQESGHSSFTVFPNATLDELARIRPTTPAELAAIKGLGPSRLERYGRAILDAILKDSPQPAAQSAVDPPLFARSAPADPKPRNEPGIAQNSSISAHVRTEEWTFRLVEKGFGLEDVVAIRNLDRTVVIRHLGWMARQGRAIAWESVAPVGLIERWRGWRLSSGDDRPPVDADEWPGLWDLFLASEPKR